MASQMLLSKGIEAVVMGGFPGPNASMVLEMANVGIISGFNGTVKDAIDGLKNGSLSPSSPGYPQPFPPAYQAYPVGTVSREEEIKYIEKRIEEIEKRLEEINKKLEE